MKYKWYFNRYSQYNILDETEDWLYCAKKQNCQIDFNNNFWDNYNATNKGKLEMTKEIFQSCPFLDIIFKKYTIECVILGGSNLYNISDNVSDYDINIFIKEPIEDIINNNDNECLFYKGRKLHWYYINFNNILNNTPKFLLYKAELYFLTAANILYGDATELFMLVIKNKIKWINEFFQANYNKINLLYNNFNDAIDKNLAYFILFYFTIMGQPIDMLLISSIKRSKYISLSDNAKSKIKALLGSLKEYCKETLKC